MSEVAPVNGVTARMRATAATLVEAEQSLLKLSNALRNLPPGVQIGFCKQMLDYLAKRGAGRG